MSQNNTNNTRTHLVESEVCLNVVRGEEHLSLAVQDHQETVQGLQKHKQTFNYQAKQKNKWGNIYIY